MNYATLRHLALTCVLLPLLCWSAHAADAPAPWKAGVATAVITPQQAMWMAGYASRTNVSQGKFDDLHAKALALEDERGGRMVFVTLDLIGIPRTLRKSLEARAEKAWQLPPGGLLLNASHTHSGPEFRVGHAPADDGEFKPSSLGDSFGRELEESCSSASAPRWKAAHQPGPWAQSTEECIVSQVHELSRKLSK